ncbi:MAG: carboxylesterase family protein [Polyangiaceae bacterium]|nr:carboxylesterase family protein [Polyangiaceae bacterium]
MHRVFILLGLAAAAFACSDDGSEPDGTSSGPGGSGAGNTGGSGGSGGVPSCPTNATPSETIAITDRGAVEGAVEEDVVVFRGIPYAAPPTGDLRFRPPELPACFDGVRDASAYGSVCPQLAPNGSFVGDEDCLTLNVFRPRTEAAPRAVLFFVHGGGNISGSASNTVVPGVVTYDGSKLAEEHDVVVVTIQYRLGALGFLNQAALDSESADGVSGNYGTLDQVAALEWVKRNIASFGGDPGRVLLFGESAGAVNTCTLLTSPLASGLFHAALMQSGSCRQPAAEVSRVWMDEKVADSSCGGDADPAACLRGLSAQQIITELPGALGVFDVSFSPDGRYGPVVDGVVLPKSPETALADGTFEHVPFVVGANAEELAALITTTVDSDAEYVAAVEAAMAPFGAQATEDALALYPSSAYPSPQDALVALISDQRFLCPSRRIARVASGHGSPVYRYFFRRRADAPMGPKPAQHCIELLYVFGALEEIPGFNPADADVDLATDMRGYWTSLAIGGAPQAEGAPAWPAYDPQLDNTIVFDSPIGVENGIRTAECDFWESLIPPG